MDSRWYKEDRALSKDEQKDAKESSEKALKNSTLFQRRLTNILKDLIEEANRDDEDFTKRDWHTQAVATASRRKTLRLIIKLIDLK